MQINIEVNETQFKDIMEKSLADLPQEKLQEVILEGMKKYIAESDMIPKLLTEHSNYYGSSTNPSNFLMRLIDKMDSTDKLNDIRDEMLNLIRENYDKILREAIAQTLINGLASYNNDGFRNAVSMIICEQMRKENKNA